MCVSCCFVFFFFKQKTAYEMRISDWSSDVCSSDLVDNQQRAGHKQAANDGDGAVIALQRLMKYGRRHENSKQALIQSDQAVEKEIGRASWRERGCQYV